MRPIITVIRMGVCAFPAGNLAKTPVPLVTAGRPAPSGTIPLHTRITARHGHLTSPAHRPTRARLPADDEERQQANVDEHRERGTGRSRRLVARCTSRAGRVCRSETCTINLLRACSKHIPCTVNCRSQSGNGLTPEMSGLPGHQVSAYLRQIGTEKVAQDFSSGYECECVRNTVV